MASDLEDAPSQAIGAAKGKRSARVLLSDSEDDEPVVSGVNGLPKRPRASSSRPNGHRSNPSASSSVLNGNGRRSRSIANGHGSEENEDLMDEDEIDGENGQPVHIGFRPEYDRDRDGFVAGSIVRIKMRNFMTYDFVEFKPGPHLNMILGPNGTGKSSIAACIAIGLGFPPVIMGRASDLKAYVKQGAEEAETEIELKGKRGERNVKIMRKFNREDNKSEWLMNGRTTTQKAVADLVMSFGVQANNLCSFLPQDKVAEFAKMAPVTVLKETMRAAGDPRLTRWHETLKDKGAKLQVIEDVQEKDVAKRDEIQKQVDRMEPDVRNLREREDQQMRLEVLKLLDVAAERKEHQDKFDQVTRERKDVMLEHKELQKRRQPLLDLQEKQSNRLEKANAILMTTAEGLVDYKDKSRKLGAKVKKDKAAPDDTETSLKAVKAKIQQATKDKEDLKRKIRGAQAKLDSPRDDQGEKLKELNAEKRKIANKFQEARDEQRAVDERHRNLQEEAGHLNREIADLDARQRELSSIERQRENIARDFDGSINYALDWIEKNGMQLEGIVHKPPMISVNVTDKAFAWQVEACTSVSNRKCFICESRRDYNLLLTLNNREYPARRDSKGNHQPAGRVRLTLQHIEVNDDTVNPARPCDAAKLQELGFAGFAIDFVECAPAVRAYLNTFARMHQAALTRQPASRINVNATTAAGLRQWVTATDVNRAVQSNYGRRDFQITTQPSMPARAFNYVVDAEALKNNQRELAARKQALLDKEQPLRDIKHEAAKVKAKGEELRKEQTKLDDEIQQIRKENSLFAKAGQDKDRWAAQLAELEAQPSGEEQIRTVRAAKLRVVKKYVRVVDTLTDHNQDVIATCSKRGQGLWAALQYGVNTQDIERQVKDGDEKVAELDQVIADYNSQRDNHRAAAARLLREYQDVGSQVHPEVRERADEEVKGNLPSRTSIQDEIAEVENRLELTISVDPGLVERFERSSRELALLKATVDRQEEDSIRLKRQINKILADFNPALDTLVDVVSGKFSAAFDRVGCTGEVTLNRVEGDFGAWGIHIMVSYRDGDNLQQLTGTLQSGGERSLATVTYLMSLSEMARTPFSLVDEINQGMDQKAERNVHNQLVEVTCSDDAGQYFLITPKLLTGLKYQRKMKILIVNNGSYLADSTTNLDKRFGHLRTCLQKYKSFHVAAH